MERSYYHEYFFFEQDNWWFVSRRRILLSLLRRQLRGRRDLEILDAGCGTGINLAYLREFGRVTGVDISPEAIDFCRSRGAEDVQLGDLRDAVRRLLSEDDLRADLGRRAAEVVAARRGVVSRSVDLIEGALAAREGSAAG